MPLTYVICFLMAFYGPNADIMGNIKLTIWHYEAVSNIKVFLQNLSLLVCVDFMSGVINGIILWTVCKINIYKILQKIQNEYWLIMAVQEAYLFWAVSR